MMEKIITLEQYKNDEYPDMIEEGLKLEEIIIGRHKIVKLIYK